MLRNKVLAVHDVPLHLVAARAQGLEDDLHHPPRLEDVPPVPVRSPATVHLHQTDDVLEQKVFRALLHQHPHQLLVKLSPVAVVLVVQTPLLPARAEGLAWKSGGKNVEAFRWKVVGHDVDHVALDEMVTAGARAVAELPPVNRARYLVSLGRQDASPVQGLEAEAEASNAREKLDE
eukprot:3904199-Rhodomonas_salina.1